MNAPYCPDCGCHLEDSDHVFEVWFCPYCDEIVPDPEPTTLDDPEDSLDGLLDDPEINTDDLPEAP